MGIFFNNPSMVLEFEVDGKKAEDTANENDYNTDEGEETTTPKTAGNEEKKPDDGNDGVKEDDYDVEKEDEDGEEEGGDNTEEEGNDNEEDNDNDGVNEDDYTIEDEDGEEEGGDNTEEEGNDNEEDNDNDSSENDTEQMDNKLKELEGELFDTLSDEQKQIKMDELKRCYQELHNRCDNIISIINNATPPDENTSRVFEYLNDNMSDLKQYIYDYFTYTFATKEYLENDAQYQKYLAILNSFNTILEELIKKNGKDE